ncbi:GH36-type glycosyl hydrolase domain-containing protein [Pantoea sp. App145]|uniref:GH36-type glycosyl hydrolase domain-containing protein n=1 Tax=Pantoea sp. App145 TaxID=3071567 RepID=UPI003A7FAAA3
MKTGINFWPQKEGDIAIASVIQPAFLPQDAVYQAVKPEIFTEAQMESYGEKLAHTHSLSGNKGAYRLVQRLAQCEKSLIKNAEILCVGDKRSLTPAGVWVLDNFYIIEEQIRLIRQLLPAKFGQGLPVLSDPAHFLRIQAIADEMVKHSDGRIESNILHRLVSSYQRVTPLMLGELWALPTMLRFALITHLARIVEEVAATHQERLRAETWIDKILITRENDAAKAIMVVAEMARLNPMPSGAFVAELARRLSGQNPTLTLTWIEQHLQTMGLTVAKVIEQFNRQLALSQLSVSNCIAGLRQLGEIDWQAFIESLSLVETVLCQDPAEIYPRMHFDSRDSYRHIIEQLARHSHFSEQEVAQKVLALSSQPELPRRQQHIGFFLLDKGRAQLEQHLATRYSLLNHLRHRLNQTPLLSWLGSLLLLTTACSAEMLLATRQAGMNMWIWLLFIPVVIISSQLVVQLLSEVTTRSRVPASLPRLNYESSIPDEARTLVVIPCMLESHSGIDALLRSMEVCYLGNALPNIVFALLTDLTDNIAENAENDSLLVDYAVLKTAALNRRYMTPDESCPRFTLLHRNRELNEAQGIWMGYERKRGKLNALNRWLLGGSDSFSIISGATQAQLSNVKYVITLDSDTVLPREAAHRLIGMMAHPLNTPVFDQHKQRVVAGYAILQPRLAEEIPRHGQSIYAKLCSGVPGNDPYSSISSDIYQDLFGEGSFVGKGIYDVSAFTQATLNACPENLVLSHDLLEGCYARSGVASNVVFYEQYPEDYLSDVARRFRWIRGDWQLLNWLRLRVNLQDGTRQNNPLSALSRWKIFDNLRRSLVAPLLLLVIFFSLTIMPNPGLWLGGIVLFLVLPALCALLMDVIRKGKQRSWPQHYRIVLNDGLSRLCRSGLFLATLPYESYWSLKAIIVTLWRLNISHRNLSEWANASQIKAGAKLSARHYFHAMWINPLAGITLLLLTGLMMPTLILIALTLALVWIITPEWVRRISHPAPSRQPKVSAEQQHFLRLTARRTWAWFDEFVNEKENFLPPDNFQEIPEATVAHRTSPTNIGLSLLATLTAWDFGYLTQRKVLARTTATLDALDKMEHFRGHLYNWYDTLTLLPLHPRYVSSVDSGNLAAHLITLQAGLSQWKNQPLFIPSSMVPGLRDTLYLAEYQCSPTELSVFARLHAQLDIIATCSPNLVAAEMTKLAALNAQAISRSRSGTKWLKAFFHQLNDFRDEWALFFDWLSESQYWPAEPCSLLWLANLAKHRPELTSQQTQPVMWAARQRLATLIELETRLRDHAKMDFRFLYHSSTALLSVGHNCESGLPDSSKYDLFPSEVRLTHYYAISANQLPMKSWFTLGRLFTLLNGQPAVMSWSGSMFEYLMPHLVMPFYPETLLEKMARSAVRQQIASGKSSGTPWGVSESAYASFDANHNYQYKACGTPELGLKNGLNEDHVVAPYATLLALMVFPHAAIDNLYRLKTLGATGEYGFYEALDFTPQRLTNGQRFAPVKTYMAHHQGMGLLAISHLLFNAPMVERFMSSALFQSSRLLMQERLPDDIELYTPRRQFVDTSENKSSRAVSGEREFSKGDTRVPQLQLLSNADYHLMITQTGVGYSTWQGLALTRWRCDASRNNQGIFCYIRDLKTETVMSNVLQPVNNDRADYHTHFRDAGVEFHGTDGAISAQTHIVVSPEDDIEIRRITLTNRSRHPGEFDITTYAEVVLAPADQDLAHPAFSNLFVQTEIVAELEAILAHRRPRTAHEATPWMFHAMVIHGAFERSTSFETDRARFIGRGNSVATPQALAPAAVLSNSDGSVLDPVLSIRQAFRLKAGESVVIDMIYGVTLQRDTSLSLIEKYRNQTNANRIFELAWSHSQVVLRQLNVTAEDASLFNQLASAVIFLCPEIWGDTKSIQQNRLGQSALWRYSLSGDLPIVVLVVDQSEQMDLVLSLIQAHQYWRQKGLLVDLVILNMDHGGYQQTLHSQILGLLTSHEASVLVDKPGGIFLRKEETFTVEDLRLLMSVAAVVLRGSNGSLTDQLSMILRPVHPVSTRLIPTSSPFPDQPAPSLATQPACFFNGIGGFTTTGSEYQICLKPGQQTPAPWCNVLANPLFGSVISESGQAYSFYENAHEYRLTPWENDPVSDLSGEAFYIRDEESGEVWSPMPLPIRGTGDYLIKHGFGYSTFDHTQQGITSAMTVFVAESAAVKLTLLTIRNHSGRSRQLSVTGYVQWVLGELASKSASHIVTSSITPTAGSAILANNYYGGTDAARSAFFAVTGNRIALSANCFECLGPNGTVRQPAMMQKRGLSGTTGAGYDPCATLQSVTTLIHGDSRSFVFVLGVGKDLPDVCQLLEHYLVSENVELELGKVKTHWQTLLDKIQIVTPDPAVNILANGWLLYQTIASRLLARSGYYQSGGAYGFRDQLQDTLALSHSSPDTLRNQLILCASRQFLQGDVQHWWHMPGGKGVRTRCSDDYLWLPFALCRYIEATEDLTVLSQVIPYLEGRLLDADEESIYEKPDISQTAETLWQHCICAIKHGLNFGEHGLPLMGSGDWNDGMNTVGIGGKGESVWLGFFLYSVLTHFSTLADRIGDHATGIFCRQHAEKLRVVLNDSAWDGNWYLRGYFDNGEKLGSGSSVECQIDAIAQSWAVLSGAGDAEKCRIAMAALDTHLVDEKMGLIKLLTPPFNGAGPNPGYIRGYLPGIRENGGQYTHGALWAIMAFAQLGDIERAWSLLALINPVNHSLDASKMAVYKVEPYVMAADIYAAASHAGRGGWTWYTGSAGWTYQLITGSLLGIVRHGECLALRPRLPAAWPEVMIIYKEGHATYHINVVRGESDYQLWLDGNRCPGDEIHLSKEPGDHEVKVVLANDPYPLLNSSWCGESHHDKKEESSKEDS